MDKNFRTLKIIFNKSGGKNPAITNRLTIPSIWINEMGITSENREVEVEFIEGEIIIKKR